MSRPPRLGIDIPSKEPRDPFGVPELLVCIGLAAIIVAFLFGMSEFAKSVITR